jgi:YD repeat-containing protein
MAAQGVSAAVVNFSYDAAGRLTKATHGDGQSFAYSYDGAGNVISLAIVGSIMPSTVTIVASAGMGGSIQPAGAVSINFGTNCSFTITPMPQYNISYLIIDGLTVSPATSYAFTAVTADHAIQAAFVGKFQDFDNDGLLDTWEYQYFSQLNLTNGSGDADGDGLSDRAEYAYGLNPKSRDSDADGMPDKWEIDHGLDAATADGDDDADGDGWSNYLEYRAGTDPMNVLSHPSAGGSKSFMNLLLLDAGEVTP